MCQAELNKSFTCRHKWLTIVRKCEDGGGFNDNHLHKYRPARLGLFHPKFASAAANTCPNCDLKGDYDTKTTRMILDDPRDRGTLGNGYTMTDGYGRPLLVYNWNQYAGYGYTSCGMTRTSAPAQMQDPGCGCTIM
ncbi:hypothetical protein EDD37DRAFT_428904 [Exophiala viscosa]|uniref:Uncharacterized protein n=1 Tax=Exophiala viscosa TaxID=2486360 RepID=A0AAN6DUH1_9EURO|nr:hypothetical protein EDD36DRAFT_293985 [Exophiala viscosa]KAI1623562.1 hypothetical protein EDD37DRAFT_428904 [Exophiala viscosa]